MPPRTPPWWHSTTTRSRSCRSRATLNICSVSSRSLKVCEAKALRAAPASPILTTWCSSPCHHLSLQSCHCGDPKRCAGTKLGPSSSRRTTPRRWWCPQWAPRMVLRCAGESTDGMLCCCFLPFLLKILSSQFKPFLWAVWCRKLIPGSVPQAHPRLCAVSSVSSSIESGYFAVLESEPSPLLEAPLARGSSLAPSRSASNDVAPVDSVPVSKSNSAPDKPTTQYRMIWTPNNHFKASGCLADSPTDNEPGRPEGYQACMGKGTRPESPLPTGWDMAYDPITGHDYFIDHAAGTTTWERPVSADLDPPG